MNLLSSPALKRPLRALCRVWRPRECSARLTGWRVLFQRSKGRSRSRPALAERLGSRGMREAPSASCAQYLSVPVGGWCSWLPIRLQVSIGFAAGLYHAMRLALQRVDAICWATKRLYLCIISGPDRASTGLVARLTGIVQVALTAWFWT